MDLLSLPVEVLYHCFSCLTPSGLQNLWSTCHYARTGWIRNTELWQTVVRQNFPNIFYSLTDLPHTIEHPLIFKSRWNWDMESLNHVLFFTVLETCQPCYFWKSSKIPKSNPKNSKKSKKSKHELSVEPISLLELMKTRNDKPKLLTLACYVLKRLCFQQLTEGNLQEEIIGKNQGV